MATCEAIAADPVQHGARYPPRAHAHNRAQRYVEKAFLVALWRAWGRLSLLGGFAD